MAKCVIYSKNGHKKYEGYPTYVDSYLKVGYIEFREVSSPLPINWEIGDYVVYPRTGLTYRLYSVPVQAVMKQARSGSYGAAFVYRNVQFYEPTKMLELAPFRDLVRGDNKISFSTQNNIAVWDDVAGIAERIEVSLNDMFPGEWKVNVVETTDVKLLETLSTELNYSVEGVSCMGALEKIYELWDNIGWIYSFVNGKHTITIGGADIRSEANTAPELRYGKGNGLVTLEQSISNRESMATRLYVYGSSKNMISRYYNNVALDIKDKESIDIQNLMLPIEPIAALQWNGWGKTDGKYDASKSYIEDSEAIRKYGLIVKSVYLDGSDTEDIHPSLRNITIGELRNLIGSPAEKYYPKTSIYKNDLERVDLVKAVVNPADKGTVSSDGSQYLTVVEKPIGPVHDDTYVNGDIVSVTLASLSEFRGLSGQATLRFNNSGYFYCEGRTLDSYNLRLVVTNRYGKRTEYSIELNPVPAEDSNFTYYKFTLPEIQLSNASDADVASVDIIGEPLPGKSEETIYYTFHLDAGTLTAGLTNGRSETFSMTLKQIGFDINERASLGEGKSTIVMTSGMCVGRSFLVKRCDYNPVSDSWELTVWRQADDSIGMWYPNDDFKIAEGDSFVLVDIAMPDTYIKAAEQKLLIAGRKQLAELSSPIPVFTPKIDAKVLREYQAAHNTELSPLRAGMYLHVDDSDIQSFGYEYILIDSVTINEGESNIPTYSITLREKKKVTIKESISASSLDMSTSVKGNTSSATQQSYSPGLTEVSWEDIKDKPEFKDLAFKQTINEAGGVINDGKQNRVEVIAIVEKESDIPANPDPNTLYVRLG